ncbi:MAG: hypothetical protein Q9197_001638 [Variospora fuerteventurae]
MLAKLGVSHLFAALVVCDSEGHVWQHPQSTDRRSPCPAVIALANHGFLPYNRLNIFLEQFINGVTERPNFETNFTIFTIGVYQNITTTGYSNTLNLDDLDHYVLLSSLVMQQQHDGSLSRNDLYFGDNHSLNKKIRGTVAARFPHDTISIPAARARKHRFAAAKAVNPKFTCSIESSTADTALYLKAMRGQDEETKTRYVHISFRELRFLSEDLYVFLMLTKTTGEERVPFNEGQKKSNRRSLPKI